MRKFNDIYSSFAANALNYDSSAPNQRLKIEPWLLQLYIDNGLRFPLNRICSGLMPQLYISTFESGYIASNAGYGEYYPSVTWVIFFVRYDGKVINLWEGDPAATLAPPTRTLNECMQHPEIAAIFGDSEKFYKQFSATEKCSIGGKRAYYGKCVFDSSLNMIYKYFFGCSKDPVDDANLWKEATYIVNSNGEKRDVDVSAIGYSFSASLGEVFIGDKIGYFTQKEANAFLDQIRIAIDQLNNKLSVVSTTLGIYNQDLQQNYSVATSALDATEEAQQKTARNIR
jgi:hypothetical protein